VFRTVVASTLTGGENDCDDGLWHTPSLVGVAPRHRLDVPRGTSTLSSR
jgi:hypothetical protein